jgi:hypothetical protein
MTAGPRPFLLPATAAAAGEDPATFAAGPGQPPSPTAGEGATTTVVGPGPFLPLAAPGQKKN